MHISIAFQMIANFRFAIEMHPIEEIWSKNIAALSLISLGYSLYQKAICTYRHNLGAEVVVVYISNLNQIVIPHLIVKLLSLRLPKFSIISVVEYPQKKV